MRQRKTSGLVVLLMIGATTCAAGGLPVCDGESPPVPDGWRRVAAPSGDIELRLPPDMQEQPGKVSFIHGGTYWEGPDVSVKVTYGQWSLSSFDHAEEKCRTRINGIRVVRFAWTGQDGYELAAWLRTKGEPYEPVLGITFIDPKELAVAEQILASVARVE